MSDEIKAIEERASAIRSTLEADAATVAKLKAAHGGDLFAVRVPGVPLRTLHRRAAPDEFELYLIEAAEKGERAVRANVKLFKRTCVHPDPATLEAVLEKYPAVAFVGGTQVAQIAGFNDKVEVEKV